MRHHARYHNKGCCCELCVDFYATKPWMPWLGNKYKIGTEKHKIWMLGKKIRASNRLSKDEYRAYWDGYLKSKEWQARRTKVFARAKGICERCNSSPVSDCHHIHYTNKFNEPLSDLIGLCRCCHRNISEIQKLISI